MSGFNRFAAFGIGVIFMGLWLSMGAMFIGIFIGAVVGWITGTVIGENTYGTALIGAASGAVIGIIGVWSIIVGIALSKNKDGIFGWKSSKVWLVGTPTVILLLFIVIVVTIPIHDFLLGELIIPFFSHPPNIPEKQVRLPDGFVNVFHFSDRTTDIFPEIQRRFLFQVIQFVVGVAIVLFALVGIIRSGKKESSLKVFLQAAFIIFLAVLWVSLSNTWLRNISETKNSSEQAYQHLLNIYKSRQYQVVEGPVKVLHIFPPGGHDRGDIIVVNEVEFEISPHSHAFFYDKPIVQGGVLTDGKYVRLYYYEDMILAIDIKFLEE